MAFEKLLEPITINGMTLKNRMVVAPLATNYATRQGFVTDRLTAYYAEKAKGGFSLIETEIMAVCPQGRAVSNQIGIWDDEYIDGLKKLTAAVHQYGAKVIAQLHHCGRASTLDIINDGEAGKGLKLEAPSPIADCAMNDPGVHELTTEEVYRVIKDFAMAAVRAQKAGFDGIQIHCTHGYLLTQFLSRHSNKRIDEFGGSIRGRAKIVMDIIKMIRALCGADFVIDLRMDADEFTEEGIDAHEAAVFLRLFKETGIDMANVSCCNYHSVHMMAVTGHWNPGYNLENIRKVKEYVGDLPVVAGGRINDPDLAEYVVADGIGDMVFFGREHVCDPHFPEKIIDGRLDEISPCISCNESCLSYLLQNRPIGCLVNPMAGHEYEWDLDPVPEDRRKKIVIIGAGPGGLVAAWTAAARGHTVDLYDQESQIGGAFRLAAFPPGKQAIAKAIRYYGVMCEKYGVNIHLNTRVDEDLLRSLDADIVVLATGARPLMPSIPGIDKCDIITSTSDVLQNRTPAGQNVLIAGGGFMAAELAAFLLEHGKDVTLIEQKDEIASDQDPVIKPGLRETLAGHGIGQQVLPRKFTPLLSTTIKGFTEDGVIIEKDMKRSELSGFDTIVMALGMESFNPLEEVAKKYFSDVRVIGEAKETSLANKVTEAAIKFTMSL